MHFIEKYWKIIIVVFVLSMIIKPAICFLILGTLLTYIGFVAISFLKNIARNGIVCTGQIIEYQKDSDGYKTPVIEFTTQNGELIREKPHVYASTDLSKIRTYNNSINQPVPILYDPDDPCKFVITTERQFNHAVFIIIILAGLFFTGLSFAALFGYINMG